MLCEFIYLAIAIFYKKFDPEKGLKFLTERIPVDQLPEVFWIWYQEHESRLRDELQYYSKQGIHFTYPGCWDYPRPFLKNLESSPLFISYMGNPQWTERPSIGIVGSRKISSLTKEWMDHELVPFLHRNDVSVISGGARGVDQAAHFCALRAKRPTFVFLPSGLAEMYPRDLTEWKSQIISSGGAFLSEYWPSEKIKKHYFIERNRLIAAMSDFVLIAQGEKKSGTLLTAQWALDLGRDLGVLPGHPMDFNFSGNLHLMRSGVPSVIDALDLENMMQMS